MREKNAVMLQILSLKVFVIAFVCVFFLSSLGAAVGRQLVTWPGETVQSCPVGSVAPGDLNVMEKPQNTSEDNLEESRNMWSWEAAGTLSRDLKNDWPEKTNKQKNPDAVHFCDAKINQNHHILFCECSTFDFFMTSAFFFLLLEIALHYCVILTFGKH